MIEISTDAIILLEIDLPGLGRAPVPATIVFTWIVMAVITLGAWAARPRLDRLAEGAEGAIWRESWLEAIYAVLRAQLIEIAGAAPAAMLAFVGTLFLFIFTANLMGVIPGFESPTGSLSTTSALALAVFIAVPVFGVGSTGVVGYLRKYLKPTPLMLPFNIIGELSRTVALAVRLYGNAMSGGVLVGVLISVAPILFPAAMQVLELLTGSIQAYIFAVLAAVYIGAALGEPSPNDREAPVDPLEPGPIPPDRAGI